jgi:sporulation protein YlmC with PRC-barrel domain
MEISCSIISKKYTMKLLARLTIKATVNFLEKLVETSEGLNLFYREKYCPVRKRIIIARQTKDKGVTKDKLVGMKVIDSKGYMIGTVKDIGFTVGKLGINLTMEDNEGEIKEIAWDEVQAAGDFVLLKPQSETPTVQTGPQAPVTRVCPTCQGPLSYIQQYQRWYCYRCQKYV